MIRRTMHDVHELVREMSRVTGQSYYLLGPSPPKNFSICTGKNVDGRLTGITPKSPSDLTITQLYNWATAYLQGLKDGDSLKHPRRDLEETFREFVNTGDDRVAIWATCMECGEKFQPDDSIVCRQWSTSQMPGSAFEYRHRRCMR